MTACDLLRRSTTGTVLLLATGLFLMAENPCAAQDTAGTDTAADTKVNAQELQREWDEAMEALKTYSAAQRDQAMADARSVLDAMDDRIDHLESRAAAEWSKLSDAARERRKAALQALRLQRNELAVWYGGMRHGSADAWDEVRAGFVEAYHVLGDAFRRARNEFQEPQTTPSQASGN